MNRVHLDRMPKARLIAMIHEAQSLADSHAATAERWRGTVSDLIRTMPNRRGTVHAITREQTEQDAAAILARLPRDPNAAEHRATLAANMELAPPPSDARCGTPAGHSKHRRRRETPCAKCRAAYNRYRAKQRPSRARQGAA